MTFEIVAAGPRRRFGERFGPPLLAAIGTSVVAASAICLLLVGPLLIVFAIQTFAPDEQAGRVLSHVPDVVRSNLWLIWPTAVIAIGGPYPGVLMQNSRRNRALFLRRFGDTDATSAVSAALNRMGRRWLVITLDDGNVAAISTGARAIRSALSIGGAAAEVGIEIAVGVAKIYRALFVVCLLGSTVYFLVAFVSGSTSGWNIIGIVGVCAAIFAAGIITALLSVPLLFSALALADDAKRRDSRYSAGSVEDLLEIRNKLRDQTRSFFAAKLAVVTVETSRDADLWRAGVSGFALHADAAIIDISYPTGHVAWEVSDMLTRLGERCVIVGEAGRLEAIQAATPADSTALDELLIGRRVLSYQPTRHGLRRFARSLQATLEARIRGAVNENQDDTLMDPAERADALFKKSHWRYQHNFSTTDAVSQTREAIRIYAELAHADPARFADKHAQAARLLESLEVRQAASGRRWSRRR
ncbi:hypothetical protein SAMN05892883_2794 [Jatrophihabitans sp. GAS493]|uniref:hypothetical protein n=1 Tax=Jatrophihabitans sp. GAS493 TaxID=1907575 RepID=UPI000BB89BD0|nr:hypothetical protein [Jatrophihabitans sp. GAS493]SOD73499.1 hypothetical protein SAMN05892883_2794 [Jatrophihabitans sp. GAS493]